MIAWQHNDADGLHDKIELFRAELAGDDEIKTDK
jgi:hypothetical protein